MDKREKTEIIINQIAQDIVTLRQGEKWFADMTVEEQYETLKILQYCVFQSHPLDIERKYAVLESGLRPTYTPCVMLLKHGKVERQVELICKLPSNEYHKIFRLLITLLGIADYRRRLKCQGKCSHWWHKSLDKYSLIETND